MGIPDISNNLETLFDVSIFVRDFEFFGNSYRMIRNCLDPIVRVLCSIIFIERRLGIGVSSFKCDGYSNMIGVEILRIRNTYQKANLKARSNNQHCIVELL